MGGPHVVCYFNGVPVGRVTAFSFRNELVQKEVRGIDFPLPFEIGGSMVATSGTIQLLRTTGDGGSQGMGIMPQQVDIASGRYFTILILDLREKRAVFYSEFCKAESEEWSISARSVITGTVSFKAISFSNEASSVPTYGI